MCISDIIAQSSDMDQFKLVLESLNEIKATQRLILTILNNGHPAAPVKKICYLHCNARQ